MADANPTVRGSPSAGDGPEHKRRKVRKGTQSCWECKRRKIRCTFAVPTESVCDGCKRRWTTCISQEFPDEPAPSMHVGARLGRMEELVEQLVKNSSTIGIPEDASQRSPPDHRSSTSTSRSPNPNASIPTAGSEGPLYRSWLGPRTGGSIETETLASSIPRLNTPLHPTLITLGQNVQTGESYDHLSRGLLEAWPSQSDLDIILRAPVGISPLLHGVHGICAPYSTLLRQDMPSPRTMLELPPPRSHPVLIARKLLILGAFLQSVPASFTQDAVGLSTSCCDIMSRAVETAIRLVTSNDELVGSIEGIECIMIESMYQNNAGNLRRGWLATRRAMLIAQMMGLDRAVNSASLKLLELESRERVSPEYMWFRLVHSDRYFSLMLGLPQGCLENNFATRKGLESCTPLERMERIDCVVAGRVLQRNSAKLHDLATTEEMDKLLQKASASMPAQWWLIPNLASSAGNDMEACRETVRMMSQFTHYSLLAQLHLPYMLRISDDHKYDYSKITAVNASRELLARFVSYRSFNPGASYCRGIDFLAFIGSTVLCLAHIDAHRQRQTRAGNGSGGFDFLAHQRLGDRGMMERALESMESMALANNDVIASKIAKILQPLLAIETDAANGGRYSASSSSGGNVEDLVCGGNVSDAGNVLRIYIPYFGTIKIERGGVSTSILAVTGVSDSGAPLLSESREEHGPPPAAKSPAGYRVGGQSVNADWQAIPSQFDPLVPLTQSASVPKDNGDGGQDGQLLVPGLTADVDDWALQGVDMALFDNLIRGAAMPHGSEEESWALWMGNETLM